MAVYFNLGIDCGRDEIVANTVVLHFEGYSVPLPNSELVKCDVSTERQRNFWFVGVWPEGMSYGSPSRNDRPSLVDEHMVSHIRNAVYDRLSTVEGFRRAMFGGEAFDQLAYADADEDNDVDYVDMIYSVREFPNDPANCAVKPFSVGYKIVEDVRR